MVIIALNTSVIYCVSSRGRLPKRSSQNKEERKLAKWVSTQRSAHDQKTLSEERAKALNNINTGILAWKLHLSRDAQPSDEWEKAFQDMEELKKRHHNKKMANPQTNPDKNDNGGNDDTIADKNDSSRGIIHGVPLSASLLHLSKETKIDAFLSTRMKNSDVITALTNNRGWNENDRRLCNSKYNA